MTETDRQEEHQPDGEAEGAEGLVPEPRIRHREGMEWYVVHTYSGFEKKVKESLEQRIEAFNMQEDFGEVLIPTEDVVEMKGGKKVITQKKYFPGYVLVQMKMTDSAWHLVKNTPKVTGFIGPERKPIPITRDEVDSIIKQVTTAADKPKPKFHFDRGDQIRVVDGPFTNFTGVVEEVNEKNSTLKLMVTIFGRATPVELNFLQVEKV
jgi:transcriptional antiterminator NusG